MRAVALARTRHDGDGRREAAMCQRNPGIGRNSQRRADAGHNLEPQPSALESFGLFAAAPEQKRVASLEPHDALSGQPVCYEQTIDLVLRRLPTAADFADINALGFLANMTEQLRINQVVVDHNVARRQKVARLDGE